MATKKKMLQAAAGSATGGSGLDIDEVFSTYLYEGTGSAQTITNGIDLDGEGGLVWIKNRDYTFDNTLVFKDESDTLKFLNSASTSAASGTLGWFSSFNSNGFSITSEEDKVNYSSSGYNDYVSWTFRKAPKFFDVVTYTGTQVAGLAISHNLGSVPGTIIVKRTNDTNAWTVYHRSLGNNKKLELNKTDSIVDIGNSIAWNTTTPTDTQFFLGADGAVNANGGTYVAYLFAHNDGDGEFGPDGDQDIIKCGSYTGGGSSDVDVNLGFEPQFVIVKGADISRGWVIGDIMRGAPVGSNGQRLFANTSDAETTEDTVFTPTPTGFKVKANTGGTVNDSGLEYIYIAIRRGPLAPPESATEVFAIDTAGGTSPTPPTFTSGFPVDFSFYKNKTDGSNNWGSQNRLTGYGDLAFNTTSAEFSNNGSYWQKDYMNGIGSNTGTNSNGYQWMWKRAPGYFDVVAYTGDGTAGRTVSHNLGVAPEMMWVKLRNQFADSWVVYHKDLTSGYNIFLDSSAGESNYGNRLYGPSATTFTVSGDTSVNNSYSPSLNYIAYLFASLPGISKVGSYTGTGNTAQTIDCGFTSGARFVLIKRSNGAGQWHVFDTERGITSTVNDGVLYLNLTNAEQPESSAFGASIDAIQPDNSGFKVQYSDINASGETFIFYAIA